MTNLDKVSELKKAIAIIAEIAKSSRELVADMVCRDVFVEAVDSAELPFLQMLESLEHAGIKSPFTTAIQEVEINHSPAPLENAAPGLTPAQIEAAKPFLASKTLPPETQFSAPRASQSVHVALPHTLTTQRPPRDYNGDPEARGY